MVRKYRRIIVGVVLALVVVVCSATGVLAANPTVGITVTAVSGGITDFTIEYISETQLDITWGYSGDAVNVMIRAKYGEFPANIPDALTEPSDGYLVYYGNGVATSDTSMDFDENPGPLYYRAWAEDAGGNWEIVPKEGTEESNIMTLLFLGGIPLALVIAMFAVKNEVLGYAAALFWAILGAYCYTLYTTPWVDWEFFMMFGCFLCGVPLSLFGSFTLKEGDRAKTRSDIDDGAEISWDDDEDGFSGEEKPKPAKRKRTRKSPQGEFD